MNTNELEAFVTIVDKQSYSLAADNLGISTSALSRRISSLEKTVACQLLRRDSHRITLTSSGLKLYPYAADIVGKIQKATIVLTENQSLLSGSLTVFSSLGMAKLLMPVLKLFSETSPELTIEWILSEGRQEDLAKIHFDVMLHIDNPRDSNLVGRYLGDIAMDYYATPKYLARKGRICHAEDIAHLDTIYSSATPSAPKTWTLRLGMNQRQVELQPKYFVGSPDLALELALAHLGIARLPKFLAQPYVNKSQLALACTDPQSFAFPIYAIYPNGKFLPEKTKQFIQTTKELIENLS
ncbi:LysR family transcriptional regulator [Photobacterium sp. DNB22_13_2]